MAVVSAKLTFKLPVLVYTWEDKEENERCSVDMLLISGTTEDHLRVTVEKGGKYLKIEYFYPFPFLSAQRLTAANADVNNTHAKTRALAKEIRTIKEAYNYEDVKAEYRIKLPVKCDEHFVDFDHTGSGVEVCLYEHDVELYQKDKQYYYMLHVELISANKVHKPTAISGFRVIGSPASTSQNQNTSNP
jgi:hypothetical protein